MIQMIDNIMGEDNIEELERKEEQKVEENKVTTNVKASELIEGINRVEKRAEKLSENILNVKKRIEEMQELIKYQAKDNKIELQNNTEDDIDILYSNEEENLSEGDNDGK